MAARAGKDADFADDALGLVFAIQHRVSEWAALGKAARLAQADDLARAVRPLAAHRLPLVRVAAVEALHGLDFFPRRSSMGCE